MTLTKPRVVRLDGMNIYKLNQFTAPIGTAVPEALSF